MSFSIDPYLFIDDESASACYCRGTLILCEDGEAPVERLRIGDRVMTRSGEARPIKWIGRRSYSGHFALGQAQILPICVTAGALDDGVPSRDLWISPNHAMYLEGALIEAKDLVNGSSIYQATTVNEIDYFHIELESHDLIVAEGAVSEPLSTTRIAGFSTMRRNMPRFIPKRARDLRDIARLGSTAGLRWSERGRGLRSAPV